MDMYYVATYFNDVCKANYAAYDAFNRLSWPNEKRMSEVKWKEFIVDADFWGKRMDETDAILTGIVTDVSRKGEKLIITSKEEVLFLIRYFMVDEICHHKCLVVDESYPTDEVSERFRQAYLNEDQKMLGKLYQELYCVEED